LATRAAEESTYISTSRVLADSSRESSQNLKPSDLDTICDLGERGLLVNIGWGSSFQVSIFGGPLGYAEVRATAPEAAGAQSIIDAFMSASGLQPYVPDEAAWDDTPPPQAGPLLLDDSASAMNELARRIDRLEAPGAITARPRLRAFLSYRFSDEAAQVLAARLQRFLNVLDTDVVSGVEYEPRPVSQKVAGRLSSGIDFVVLIVSSTGESPWTRDEIATANALGVPIVPLVEEGSTMAPGIFGDLEYIQFRPSHIDDCFMALAEAVAYVRRQSTAR
jgi:hypothetical protein